MRAKPSAPRLDRSHPLAGACRAFYAMGEGAGGPSDATGDGPTLAPDAGPGWAAGRYGWAADFAASGARYAAPLPAHLRLQPPLTVFAVITVRSSAGAFNRVPFGAIANDAFGSPYNAYAVWQNNAGGDVLGLGWNDGGFKQLVVFGCPVDVPVAVAGVFTPDDVTLYFDGAVAGTAGAPGTIQYDATAQLQAGTVPGGGPAACLVHCGAVFDRALDAARVAALSADPFALVRPRGVRRRTTPAATAPAGGSFVWGGFGGF